MPLGNFKRMLTIAIAIDRTDLRRSMNRASLDDLNELRAHVASGGQELRDRTGAEIKAWIRGRGTDLLDMIDEEISERPS